MRSRTGTWADNVSYIERSWSGGNTGGSVVSETKTCSSYITISSDTQELKDNNWYCVSSNVTCRNRIKVSSNAKLILKDGFTLTCEKGIHINSGKTLTIYGQSGDSGKLRCMEIRGTGH